MTALAALRAAWRYRFPLALVAAALAIAAYVHAVRSSGELRGSLDTISARLHGAAVALDHRKAQVDTVARVDSIRWQRWDTVYTHSTDTVRVRDTLYVRKSVADSTVRACSVAFLSCERRVAVRDSIIAKRDSVHVVDSLSFRAAAGDARRAKLVWGVVGAVIGRASCH